MAFTGAFWEQYDLHIKVSEVSINVGTSVRLQANRQTGSHTRDAFLLCEKSLKVLCLPGILVGKLYSIVHQFSVVKQFVSGVHSYV